MKLNKPIYFVVSILELSKLHMYQFYYDVMKKKYNDKTKLLFTDTDSFIFHIETADLYKYFDDMEEHVGFSGYGKPHPCYDNTDKQNKCCVILKVNMMEIICTTHWIKTQKCTVVKLMMERQLKQVKAWIDK